MDTITFAADLAVESDRADLLQHRRRNSLGVDPVLAPGDSSLNVSELCGFGTHN
jgi:hypothetical protein